MEQISIECFKNKYDFNIGDIVQIKNKKGNIVTFIINCINDVYYLYLCYLNNRFIGKL